ncbi:hypothetical protein DOE78_19015 [Bacillus sp. Y1]|nr:hypothetical protein [Bacillus sp. Y1]AYA77372.1 hypothetical protein DOE78_19015 [Bacillus sp. Y1]
MNALEAVVKVNELIDRINALARIHHYISDERDLDDDAYVLNQIKNELQTDLDTLQDKLRAVRL